MKLIGNLIWLCLAGVWMALAYIVAGVINCVFVITIPLGVQSFKMAGYALWPFGRTVIKRTDRDAGLGCLGNGIWFITAGWYLALGHLLTGVLLCLTVIGIPFGIASFKLAGLALWPFGKQIVPTATLTAQERASTPLIQELG